MEQFDFHVHTHHSPDSSMTLLEAAEAGIRAGITELCFTDHMDLGHPTGAFNRPPDFARRREERNAAQRAYPQISLGLGLEAGYMPETAGETARQIQGQGLDYVLLSTHCVDGVEYYDGTQAVQLDREAIYRRYLELVYESVIDSRTQDCYDCVGHIGYITKCTPFHGDYLSYSRFPRLFDDILSAVIRHGKGIEVNTSGLAGTGFPLPHPSVIARYHALGGHILTVGSDAHTLDRVGADCSDAVTLLREIGFEHLTTFHQRVPRRIPLWPSF